MKNVEEMKCGLEIHQRLAGRKLFCHCNPPSEEEVNTLLPQAEVITRELHVVYSELGEVDEAAERETRKERIYRYLYHPTFACLVDLDEEPPHEISLEALETAIKIAKALHMQFVDELIVMRKMVLDGSNTSGFQRTAIVAMDGYITIGEKRISIPTLCLEEESAGIEKQDETSATYSLHRLGIPLVEIATGPEISSPKELRAVAEKLGKIMRLVGGLRRGLGSIRQDVNISIEGGARVEIKGVQELELLEQVARYEILRQKNLIALTQELRQRFGEQGERLNLEPKMADVTAQVQQTPLARWTKNGNKALALLLPKFSGLIGRELCPGRRFGTELSDYAKTMGVGGIIHSDENPTKYRCPEELWAQIKSALQANEEDAFVLVIAPEERAKKALLEVLKRASWLFVPKETRKANPDGTTSYLRPLPGGARMYPETDIPIIELGAIVARVPFEDPGEKEKRIKSLLPGELGERILLSKELPLFEHLVKQGCDPKVSATTLLNILPALRREGLKPSAEIVELALLAYKNGRIAKKGIEPVLKALAQGKDKEEVLKAFAKITGEELKQVVQSCNYDMKEIMRKYGQRVEAEEVISIIKAKG